MHFQYDNTPRPNIIEGLYWSKINTVEATEGEYGPQVRFEFDLGEVRDVEGNVEHRTLQGFTSQKLSPGGKFPMSKLWRWALAMGLDPEAGFETSDLLERQVLLKVTIEPKKSDGTMINRVDIVRPQDFGQQAPGQAQQAAQPQQAAAPQFHQQQPQQAPQAGPQPMNAPQPVGVADSFPAYDPPGATEKPPF